MFQNHSLLIEYTDLAKPRNGDLVGLISALHYD